MSIVYETMSECVIVESYRELDLMLRFGFIDIVPVYFTNSLFVLGQIASNDKST
jgi:hypothetical protein